MIEIAVLMLIISAATIAWIFFYKRKPHNIAEERITKKGKIICVILAVAVPLALCLFWPNVDPEPNPWFGTVVLITVEIIALVSAFHIVRFARTPVWIVGMTAFAVHTLIIGILTATRIMFSLRP